MKKRLVVGLLSLGLAFGAVGAVSASRGVEVKEVGATTATWSLMRAASSWTEGAEPIVEGTPVTYSATAGDEFKIAINNYAYKIDGESASFLIDGTNVQWGSGDWNYKFGLTGNYTFTVAEGTYDTMAAGEKISSSNVTITYAAPSGPVVTCYSSIGGEIYNATGQSATHSLSNTTTKVSELDELSFYGYDFGGWYSDLACTTAVADTTVISADMTLYAKFTIASTTNVEYTIDYGNYLDDEITYVVETETTSSAPLWTDECELYIHYWKAETTEGAGDGASTVFPGVRLGSGHGGLVTATVPDDATGMVFSVYATDCYDGGNWIIQTSDITIAAATDTGVALQKFLQSYSSWRISVSTVDAGYAKIQTALQTVADNCGTTYSGTTATEDMNTAWAAIKEVVDASSAAEPDTTSENYTAYVSHLGGMATRAGAKGMAGLMSIYDFCVGKYGLDNHLGRTVESSPAYHFLGSAEENAAYIQIVMILGLGALAVGGFFLLRKRKGERA